MALTETYSHAISLSVEHSINQVYGQFPIKVIIGKK
jgi:hypothetical protein